MGLIDKNQVEDIKRTVTEKVDEYKKEINKGNRLKSFELALEIGKEKHRTGGYSDEQYNKFLNALAKENGFNTEMFEN